MNYNIIATGSDGNATIINDTILIDCGVPFKAIRPYAKQIRLVLMTHQHSDHFRPSTVQRLAHDRPALRWGCCEWMVKDLVDAGVNRRQIDVLIPDYLTVYADFSVRPVKLTHNVENCGYKVYAGGQSLFYATDTGTLDGITAKNFDVYLVESNHVRADLEARISEKEAAGEFSYEYAAAQNHMSFEQTVDWLAQNMGPKSIWVPMHEHKEKRRKDDGRTPDVCKDDN